MDDTKKERVMSPRGFLHKANGKAAIAASGFIAKHKEFLTSGELMPLTAAVLAKVDAGEVLPTPALEEIKVIVYNHMVASIIRQGEEAMERRANAPEAKVKPWTATVYNAKGQVCTRLNEEGEEEDLIKGMDLLQRANDWLDSRLVEGASDWFGTLTHATMTKDGEPLVFTVLRDEAMLRKFPFAKKPVMKAQAKNGSGGLGFSVKVTNDRSTFSRG